jgi:hypothetical protein
MIVHMERDPLKRMADALHGLKAEYAAVMERAATLGAEIERLEAAANVVREYAPVGRLPFIDEDAPVSHGDLSKMNLPQAAAEVLRNLKHGATTRELLDMLVNAGKLDPSKTTNHINLLNTLKRRSDWFKKEGKVWIYVDEGFLLSVNGNRHTLPPVPDVIAGTSPERVSKRAAAGD